MMILLGRLVGSKLKAFWLKPRKGYWEVPEAANDAEVR